MISIHALREEGDAPVFYCRLTEIEFLSTPSARRATVYRECITEPFQKFLSTPSARRATDFARAFCLSKSISIHALREEGDSPVRSLTISGSSISIHALREEGDI